MFYFANRAAGLLAAVSIASAASAGSVTVTVDAVDPRRVTVEANDATAEEILLGLKEKVPFEIERFGDFASAGRSSRSYSGEARYIVARVLENESHLVVTSVGARALEKVVIYGSRLAIQSGSNLDTPAAAVQPQSSAALSLRAPVPLDPATVAALDRARREAEAAKERGEDPQVEFANRVVMRRSSMHHAFDRGNRRGS